MKILQLVGFYPPVIGGIEAYVKELSELLAEQGYRITIITRYIIGKKPKNKIERYGNIKIIWLHSKKTTKINTIVTWIKAFFIALREDFDIIHTHSIIPMNLVGNLLKLLKHKKLVCTIHGTQFHNGIHNPLFRMIATISLNHSDHITAISDDLAAKANSLNLNKEVVTSKNAVNLKKFGKNNRKKIKKELGLPSNFKILITTRRLVEKNGVIYLVRAIPHILKKYQNTFLYIIGKGPEKSRLLNEVKKLKIEKYVKINSDVETKDLPDYLSDADIFILPSLIEGMSMSGLEALASELPIVGTRIGGNPQFIKDGKTGFLCNPKDPIDLGKKIIKVIESNPNKMGEKARKFAEERFGWNNRVKEWIKVFQFK